MEEPMENVIFSVGKNIRVAASFFPKVENIDLLYDKVVKYLSRFAKTKTRADFIDLYPNIRDYKEKLRIYTIRLLIFGVDYSQYVKYIKIIAKNMSRTIAGELGIVLRDEAYQNDFKYTFYNKNAYKNSENDITI
jgi:hypothetical protein